MGQTEVFDWEFFVEELLKFDGEDGVDCVTEMTSLNETNYPDLHPLLSSTKVGEDEPVFNDQTCFNDTLSILVDDLHHFLSRR